MQIKATKVSDLNPFTLQSTYPPSVSECNSVLTPPLFLEVQVIFDLMPTPALI
jgi:hypothetical protein